jgi:hypothetical protein
METQNSLMTHSRKLMAHSAVQLRYGLWVSSNEP